CGTVRLLLGPAEGAEFDHPSSIIYYRVEEILAAHQVLVGRGVRFISAPHLVHRAGDREFWLADFRDSEENVMALASWRPAAA
ncbi:MAG: VOC family protein, partial [Gemmatimonadales bacterium]|nr:VOC family protein [Gemmatimonadales bacterium]